MQTQRTATSVAWPVIHKPDQHRVPPNMTSYDALYRSFSWSEVRGRLDGLPGGGLNIAHEAVTRHAAGALSDHVAIRWRGKRGERLDITFADLERRSNRFANVLDALGVPDGAAVFTLLGRVPALYITALGAFKHRSVYCPLFSAFGPEPVRQRLSRGAGRVLVTTAALYRAKVEPIRDSLPDLAHVLIAGDDPPPGTESFDALIDRQRDEYRIGPTGEDDVALLHFTSGTTGMPKGATHVHGAILMHEMTGRYALDFHPEDVFWCTADPGWVTGASYGIVAPLTHGITMVVDEAEFDARRWYQTLQDERVTVWYTAPTAVRMLMKAGADLASECDLTALRFIASVGEPLNPEAVVWGAEAFGLPIHDNWWQTETGGIMISNYEAMDIRPGSMGKPLPGVVAGIVERRDDGTVVEITEPDVTGELALRPGWPSMFRAYLNEPERYAGCFAPGWYLTGDLARRDADGYFWFIGRGDDVIKSSGHLIGPFEVESTLMGHPAVVEAAVIGKPDPMAGEIVKAFVALRPGYVASDDLALEIIGHARRRLGAVVAPKEIAFLDTLPRTRSGKLMRRLLKARELGLPEGDTSTLEVTS